MMSGAVVVTMLLLGSVPARSQTLEELERQVEAAERRQREQEAAAKREAEARAAAERQRQAALAQQGRLVVRSNRACTLSVNGEAKGEVTPGATRTVAVQAGEQLIECVAGDGGRAEAVREVDPGRQVVVDLSVKEKLAVEPELLRIPGGSFLMGSPSGEVGRDDDEGPQTEIEVAPFRLAKYEVTVREFGRFVEATGYRTDAERNSAVNGQTAEGCFSWKGGEEFGWVAGRSWRDPGFPQGDRHPVVCVSWNDAVAYAKWLSAETGKGYRLPSEAEQEWALRGGAAGAYPWGGSAEGACVYGNVADASAKRRFPGFTTVSCDDGYVFTAPVGSLAANAYGLYDMSGNVWEWSADCYRSYPGGRRGSEAVGGLDAGCEARVLRGASWNNLPAWLRSANRTGFAPAFRFLDVGFPAGPGPLIGFSDRGGGCLPFPLCALPSAWVVWFDAMVFRVWAFGFKAPACGRLQKNFSGWRSAFSDD
jgi:formylglycine-generating enzyme required for sulfatase activity